MTRIDFYRCAEDKLRFACRLASRAFEKSSRLVVYTPDVAMLRRFDELLWTYNQTRFVPHCMAGAAVAPETPIILAASGESLPHHDVLLNLADEWPPFFATFERLLEIVSTDDADKGRARERYSFYKQRGYELNVHDVEG
ncbi:MAG TPA: DNA polymerase III subunit chi [Usitatibacter sp.]|nr:DNA polymerase III subunit chi [Usitatibacter sp.]